MMDREFSCDMILDDEKCLLESIGRHFESRKGDTAVMIDQLSEIISMTSMMMSEDKMWNYSVALSDSASIWELLDKIMNLLLLEKEENLCFSDLRLIKGIVLLIRNLSITYGKMQPDINADEIYSFNLKHNQQVRELGFELLKFKLNKTDEEFNYKILDILIVCFHCVFNFKQVSKGKYTDTETDLTLLNSIFLRMKDYGTIFDLRQLIPQFKAYCMNEESKKFIVLNDCEIITNLINAVSRILNINIDTDIEVMRQVNPDGYKLLMFISHTFFYLFDDEKIGSSMYRLEKNGNKNILLVLIIFQLTFSVEEKGIERKCDLVVIGSMCLDFFRKYKEESIRVLHSDNYNLDDLKLIHRKTIAILDVISNLLQYEQFKETMNSYGLLKQVIELLQVVENNTERQRLKDVEKTDTKITTKKRFPHVKTVIIEIITYLVYGNTDNKNATREYGGLPLVLSNCNLDVNEPFIRERCILCLKYLLEDNQENQDFIANLEAQKIEIDKEKEAILDKCGYEVDIVDGKVQLKQSKGSQKNKIEEV